MHINFPFDRIDRLNRRKDILELSRSSTDRSQKKKSSKQGIIMIIQCKLVVLLVALSQVAAFTGVNRLSSNSRRISGSTSSSSSSSSRSSQGGNVLAMVHEKIVVTGLGVISPVGKTHEEFFNNICNEKDIRAQWIQNQEISKIQACLSKYRYMIFLLMIFFPN